MRAAARQAMYGLLAMAAVAVPALSSAASPAEPMILDLLYRESDFEYKLGLTDGSEVAISCDRFTWQKVVVAVEGRSALGHHIRCVRGAADPRKLAIWIHGGPWASAASDLVLEQMAFLESGYDLFVPLYPGSSDRPLRIEGERMVPDVLDAMAELRNALDWGREYYDRVDVVGESFGGFLAASLAPAIARRGSLYLVNPSLGGERYLLDFYARTREVPLINGAPAAAGEAETTRVTRAYFHRLGDFDAMRKLREAEGLEVKLIYGGADPKLLADEMAALKALAVPGCGVDYRPDGGHEFGHRRAEYDAALALIRCGREPPCSGKGATPTGAESASGPH